MIASLHLFLLFAALFLFGRLCSLIGAHWTITLVLEPRRLGHVSPPIVVLSTARLCPCLLYASQIFVRIVITCELRMLHDADYFAMIVVRGFVPRSFTPNKCALWWLVICFGQGQKDSLTGAGVALKALSNLKLRLLMVLLLVECALMCSVVVFGSSLILQLVAILLPLFWSFAEIVFSIAVLAR